MSAHEGVGESGIGGEGSARQEQLPPPTLEEEATALLLREGGEDATPRLAERTLRDRSCFRGRVNDAGPPCGHGVLYTALGTQQYAGLVDSQDDGELIERRLGVQLLPNGTLFAGDFQGDYPHGDGVKRDPFGSQFLGQWHDGELDGLGLSVSVDGDGYWGEFRLNEPAADEETTDWKTTQQTVLRALVAERHALQAQECARDVELRVLLQGMARVGDEPLASIDEVQQFTLAEEEKLKAFLEETEQQLEEVDQDTDRWKYQEAQLKEKQKNLRREITEARAALAYVAKYVGLAETRRAQLVDAERTLESLRYQIQRLEEPVSSETQSSQLEE